MNNKSSLLASRSAWFVASLFFWVFLACMEVGRTVMVNGFPPPLGKGALPSAMDARYLVAALSIYALLSVPTALILLAAEKICSWLKEKTVNLSLNLNRMDLYLLFAWGLLCFKWISNLMPYLMAGEHLPNIPYLFIVPLLGLHLWVGRFSKKTIGYYRVNWIVIFFGTIFISKTAYDLFISSSLSVAVKVCLFIFLFLGALLSARTFYNLLNRMLLRRSRMTIFFVVFFLILLIGGIITTWHALQRENRDMPFLAETEPPRNNEGKAGKNVILVVVDCLRPDHLGCYGYGKRTSPFIDRIAASGALFEDCIAPSSWTIPSVVSLFTGVYPQEHGVNAPGTMLPDGLTTIQEILQKNMINTAAFITNDYLNPHFGFDRGFSHYFNHYLQLELIDYTASRLFFLNALLHFKNKLFYPYSVDPGGSRWWSIGFPPFNHAKRSAGRVTDDALHWIDAHRDRPFFLYLHYMDVHCPYDTIWYPLFDSRAYPDQDLLGKLTNTYDGRIVYVDRQVERIWQEIRQRTLPAETLLIITADHGEEIYDHGGTGHCTTLYDELIRVPLILINTSGSVAGERVQEQTQLIDVTATILDFFNITLPDQMKGKSLFPMLESVPPPHEPRYALSYTTRGRKSLQTEEGRALWEKKIWDQGGLLTSLRMDGKWKIIRGDDGHYELFDLHKDKGERTNIKDREEVLFEELKKNLAEASSALQSFTPRREELELSPDTRNKLRALGYL